VRGYPQQGRPGRRRRRFQRWPQRKYRCQGSL